MIVLGHYIAGNLDLGVAFLYLVYLVHLSVFIRMTTILCEKCNKNEVQIYNDCCDCCISCWYDITDPKVS